MHTPGPWNIMHDGPRGDGKPWAAHLEAAPGLTLGCPSNTEPICRVSGYLMPAEANARLIAAAPKLLEALEAVAKLDQWRHSPEWLDNPSCRVELRAAIDNALHIAAEAKGE